MDRIRVKLEKLRTDSYEILIGHGIMDRLASIIKLGNHVDRCVMVADSQVYPLYGEVVREKIGEAGIPVSVIEIPAGEASKSMDTVLDVVRQLIALNMSRKSLLIALGGGVVGDVTGFVASIYMRSIPYIQVPTTLLAQVDSSVGGKTGVDLPEGKNLLGTFYQPAAVFIELSFLETLSDSDFRSGLAEIIKYGIIRDQDMFVLLEQEREAIEKRQPALIKNLVERSCKTKVDIVEMDEREGGLRRILNFGHTLGHALEAVSDYKLSHGQAVATGMVAAAKISHKLNFLDEASCQRIINVIKQYGLPINVPAAFDGEKILSFLATDKKAVAGKPHFVLVKKIGSPFVTADVPSGIVTDVIEELTAS